MVNTFTFRVDYAGSSNLTVNPNSIFARVPSNRVPVTYLDTPGAPDEVTNVEPRIPSIEAASAEHGNNAEVGRTHDVYLDGQSHETSSAHLSDTISQSFRLPVFGRSVETPLCSIPSPDSDTDILPPLSLSDDPLSCLEGEWSVDPDSGTLAADSDTVVFSDEQVTEGFFGGSLLDLVEEIIDHSSPPPLTEDSTNSRDTSPADPVTPSEYSPVGPIETPSSPSTEYAFSTEKELVNEVLRSTSSGSVSGSGQPSSVGENTSSDVELVTPEVPRVVSGPSSTGLRGKKRKQRVEAQADKQESPATSLEPVLPKQITISVLSTSRTSAKSQTASETALRMSCRIAAGKNGDCHFEVQKDDARVTCGQELPRDDDLCRRHLALHYAERGWHHNAGLEVECPWCQKPMQFEALSRHIVNTHLLVNTVVCECTGTYSRANQPNNRLRHERSKVHQDWLRNKKTAPTSKLVDGEKRGRFVEGSNKGSKRRRRE